MQFNAYLRLFVSLLLNSIVPEAANSVWMRYLCSPKSYKSETEVISVEGLSVEFNATPLFRMSVMSLIRKTVLRWSARMVRANPPCLKYWRAYSRRHMES